MKTRAVFRPTLPTMNFFIDSPLIDSGVQPCNVAIFSKTQPWSPLALSLVAPCLAMRTTKSKHLSRYQPPTFQSWVLMRCIPCVVSIASDVTTLPMLAKWVQTLHASPHSFSKSLQTLFNMLQRAQWPTIPILR